MMRLSRRGVTLLEWTVVIAVSGILMGIAGFRMQGLHEQCKVENQTRQMQSDLVSARVLAFKKNRVCFVTVTKSGYQITEDTNDNGGTKPDLSDKAIWPAPKQFRYVSHWNGTIIMGTNGLISESTGPLMADAAVDIRFDVGGTKPEYDCISVGPTQIREGRWNGMNCAE